MEYFYFKSEQLSRLGFGMMRLPQKEDGTIDEGIVEEMVGTAIEGGVNYFDTAYPYHAGMSEVVAGRVLNQYPRKKFKLATKYPGHQYADHYDPAAIFEEQLKKCKVDYFDFYLLHNVCESSVDVYQNPKWKIIDYFLKQQEAKRIRHLGFSSHAEFPLLLDFLNEYEDAFEFAQLQLNYLDWELQKASRNHMLFAGREMTMFAMEPLRGGRLVNLNPSQLARLRDSRPEFSAAAWGLNWVRNLPYVGVILSGMSSLEQMKENIQIFQTKTRFMGSDYELLEEIASELQPMIPCTACRYCLKSCPSGLNIPSLLHSLNEARFAPSVTVSMRLDALSPDKLPTACQHCCACEKACPQKIPISSLMTEFSNLIPTLPSWKEISRQRALEAEASKVTQ